MILAEKLSQKLHNLRSKGELKDFFIFFDEYRNYGINFKDGSISSIDSPNHFCENSEGNFTIVWDDEHISKGKVNSESINNFDEFLNFAKASKIDYTAPVFIPERGIYPMVITYSKPLADMIDIPEYLLKIADVTGELDKMVGSEFGASSLSVKEGIRYAYSSRDLDEYYPYTQFNFSKSIGDKISWKIQTSDIYPMLKFQEVFSFIGDTYNFINSSDETSVNSDQQYSVILTPSTFRRLFQEQIIDNLKAENVLKHNSCFKVEDFANKGKVLGSLSLSYDPLLNHKVGTYKFTRFGLKPQKEYFVKFGKLQNMLSNHLNYSLAGHKIPTIEVVDISNIKFEGIKRVSFTEIRRSRENYIFSFNEVSHQKNSYSGTVLYFKNALYFEGGKTFKIEHFDMKVDLVSLIGKGQVELVDFVDGQIGCRIFPFR